MITGETNLSDENRDMINKAEMSRGQSVIELFDTVDGGALVGYAYVGHITGHGPSSWVYSSGAEGHLCGPEMLVMALDNSGEGVGVRLEEKDVSVFEGGHK